MGDSDYPPKRIGFRVINAKPPMIMLVSIFDVKKLSQVTTKHYFLKKGKWFVELPEKIEEQNPPTVAIIKKTRPRSSTLCKKEIV